MAETIESATPTPAAVAEATPTPAPVAETTANKGKEEAPKPSSDPEVQRQIAEKLANISTSDYILVDTTFSFRHTKEMKEAKPPVPKRPSVTLAIPLPTFGGVVTALDNKTKISENSETTIGDRNQQWLLSLVHDAINGMAREQVGDDIKPVNFQSDLDVTKLTIDYIAALPKSERTGGGISKEVWTAFGEDYTTVMVGQGVTPEAVGRAVDFLVKRLATVKTNKPVLRKLSNYLDVWFANSTATEEFQEVYDFLKNKAHQALEADDEKLAELI